MLANRFGGLPSSRAGFKFLGGILVQETVAVPKPGLTVAHVAGHGYALVYLLLT